MAQIQRVKVCHCWAGPLKSQFPSFLHNAILSSKELSFQGTCPLHIVDATGIPDSKCLVSAHTPRLMTFEIRGLLYQRVREEQRKKQTADMETTS